MVTCGGVEPQQERWLFTGRRAVLQRIVAWLREEAPGAFAVTGSPGCGKSALVDYIAALSDSGARAAVLSHAPLGPADPDPGIGAVDAVVHLADMTEQDVVVAVAEALGLPPPRTSWQLITSVAAMPSLPTLVLDGLDETVPEHFDKIVKELLVGLATVARMLLAFQQLHFAPRTTPDGEGVVMLSELLGEQTPVVDLDVEPIDPDDIERYVTRLLCAGGRDDLAQRVAPKLAGKAADRGGFGYARIATAQLMRQVIDVSADGWENRLPATTTGLLDYDLSNGAVLERDGAGLRRGARDLLHALAWGLGRGMPRSVWQAAATALSSHGVDHLPADLDWALEHYGSYIVTDEQDGEVVYRLAHEQFVEYLVGSPWPMAGSLEAEALAAALMALPEAQPAAERQPDQRSPYLRRHLVRHATMAGVPGIDALHRLTENTPEAYLPEFGAYMHRLAVAMAEIGEHDSALVPGQHAVDTYRALAHADLVAYQPHLAMTCNDVAVYLSAAGRRTEALVPGREAVDLFRMLTEIDSASYLPDLVTSLSNLAGYHAGLDRISEGVDVYTSCIDTFTTSPIIHGALLIEGAGFHIRYGDPPTGLRELVTLLCSDDVPDSIVLDARNVLRGHRSRDAAVVDRAWRAVTEAQPPDWLLLAPEQIRLVIEWISAPTWQRSKSFFAAHAERLRDDATVVVLEELVRLAGPPARRHLDLLEQMRTTGIDAAYQPLLVEDVVTDWISVASWQDSRSFAEQHAHELITPEAESALIRLGRPTATVVHLAVLGLARQDGLTAAYGYLMDRTLAAGRMRQALAEVELDTTTLLALLEGQVFGEPFAAAAHLAMVGSLAGETMNDTNMLQELAEHADIAERQRVAAEIAELISHVPEHARRLGSLPEILLRPSST